MHFLLYLFAVVFTIIGTTRWWFWLAPAYGFVLQVIKLPSCVQKIINLKLMFD